MDAGCTVRKFSSAHYQDKHVRTGTAIVGNITLEAITIQRSHVGELCLISFVRAHCCDGMSVKVVCFSASITRCATSYMTERRIWTLSSARPRVRSRLF